MNFLNKIDDIHEANKLTFDINSQDKTFSSFIQIEPINSKNTCSFIIKKQEKTKLLIVSDKQRVYLSDLQIINTILKMDKKCIDWFLQQFISLYNDESCKFQFKIDDEVFCCNGISFLPFSKPIILFSDTLIDINDFIFLINFIFAKDKSWEIISSKQNFSKITICKYIALIDHYANKQKRSADFLEAIKYPIDFNIPVDSKDTKKLFDDISAFDISLYL